MNIPTTFLGKRLIKNFGAKQFDQETAKIDKPITKFFVKIDNTGRIYLPSIIRRRIQNSASFSAVVSERRIIISDNGRYPHRS